MDGALGRLERAGKIIRRHGSGIYVAGVKTTRTIGLVFGSNIFNYWHSPYWSLLLQEAQRQAQPRHYRTYKYIDIAETAVATPAHQQLGDDLRAGRLDGLFVLERQSGSHNDWLETAGIPIVQQAAPGTPGWVVSIDNTTTVKLAVAELARRGCRRIGLVHKGDRAAAAAFPAALRQAGLAREPQRIWNAIDGVPPLRVDTNESFGRALGTDLLGTDPLPVDSLVILDDMMTRGVMQAWEQARRETRGRLTIATAANVGSPVLQPYEDRLILIDLDPGDIVRAGLDMLERLMDGAPPRERVTWVRPRIRD